MILFVDDNSGLLFIKSVEVVIEDPISDIEVGSTGYGYRDWDSRTEVREEYIEGIKLEGSPADINHQIMLFLKIFFQLCV